MARRKVRSELRPLNAAYLVKDERAATLDEWFAAFGYLFSQDPRWFHGLELTAPRFKQKTGKTGELRVMGKPRQRRTASAKGAAA